MKLLFVVVLLVGGASRLVADEAVVSYRIEVAPLLARGGCNAGACHGNLNGKGGFKLSLRGEDATFDFQKLTRDMLARRTDPANPDESLLLKKAAGRVPHEGGIRYPAASPEYAILRKWIAAGCPDDAATAPAVTKLSVGSSDRILMAPENCTPIKATAHFDDGSTRNVTALATFDLSEVGIAHVLPSGEVIRDQDGELLVVVRYRNQQVPVRVAFIPRRPVPDVTPLADSGQPIDLFVADRLTKLRILPSELCTDEVFLRRVSLDATGVLPTAEEARQFLRDGSANKREKLIDNLLARQEFADYWAMKWSDLLRNEEKSLDRKGVQVYHRWIKDWFAADKPLNEFSKRILTARGSTYVNPPANFYRAIRDPYLRAESVAQVFLGIRVSCARCHNHPFDRWTQEDYHRFAAFFPRIDYRMAANARTDSFDSHEFVGEQFVFAKRFGDVTLPRTNLPAVPKTLGTDEVPAADADRLGMLAEWVADPKNPFFAPAQANRIWFHLLGRGLVEPDDDFRAANPPSHPELLKYLADEFRAGGFRLKPMVKRILLSRTYQLSSSPSGSHAGEGGHLAHARVEALEAEQLLDAMCRVLGVSARFTGYPRGTRAGVIPAMSQPARRDGATTGERFLKVFGKPERLLTSDCERSDDTGLLQAFQMINGEQINAMLREPANALGQHLAAGTSDRDLLDELYLSAVSRFPHTDERAQLLKYVQAANDRRGAWEDVAWGLLNSKEFLLRR